MHSIYIDTYTNRPVIVNSIQDLIELEGAEVEEVVKFLRNLLEMYVTNRSVSFHDLTLKYNIRYGMMSRIMLGHPESPEQFQALTEHLENVINYCFTCYPDWSGSFRYPIQSSDPANEWSRVRDKYDYRTELGKLNFELIESMLNTLNNCGV